MKCQNCGNELGQNEVFCGQCGTPNALQAQPTEMMQAPAPRSGLLGDGYRNRSGAFPPNASQSPFSSENLPAPGQSAIRQGPQQSGGFYQDATEAISFVPGSPTNYPQNPQGSYPQQGFGGSLPGGYTNAGQFGTQIQPPPFSSGNYSSPNFPPTQAGFPNSYGQGSGSGVTPPPEKRSNVIMIVGIVCLVFAIITVGAFGALFALQSGNNNKTSQTPVAQATATPTPAPSPTPSPTPSPIPTATIPPTPAPDANFSWCGTTCAQSGYQIEFPNGWVQGQTQDGQGVQFADNSQNDIYAAVKTPSGGSSANDLLNGDLSEFQSQPGYTPPQGTQSTTISGENWSYETITYQSQSSGQVEQVVIYATIHQGKGYIIELQAPQSQFPTINSQFFAPMLGRFQFVAAGQ